VVLVAPTWHVGRVVARPFVRLAHWAWHLLPLRSGPLVAVGGESFLKLISLGSGVHTTKFVCRITQRVYTLRQSVRCIESRQQGGGFLMSHFGEHGFVGALAQFGQR